MYLLYIPADMTRIHINLTMIKRRVSIRHIIVILEKTYYFI